MAIEADFPDGTAVVIGGSGGMGAAICERLAESGTDVAFTYRSNHERAEEVQDRIRAAGGSAECTTLTTDDAEAVRAYFEELGARRRVHTVVVASGADIEQLHISELTPERWREVVDSDLNGFFNVVHGALPQLRAGGGGSFVHISSAGLYRWPERDVLSVAPKAGIEALIKGIAREEGRYGIRANSIGVGVIETGIFLRLLADGTFDDAWQEAVKQGLCLKRWGKPEEIAEAAVFLASRRAGYTTGQLLAVDGGYGV